jgi:general nucleoside transport system permease protein
VHGTHPALAARMGVRPAAAVLSTMLVAGAAAGLAGWMQVAGVQGRLYPSVAGGLGFTGLVVALLGGLRPAGVLVVALLYGVLATGAEGLQAGLSVPASLATVLQALLLGGVAVSAAVGHSRLGRPPASASRAGFGPEGDQGPERDQGPVGEGGNDATEFRDAEPASRQEPYG